MKFLITGGCGFLGSNLAAEVLSRGDELFVLDNQYRHGASHNLNWLRTQGSFEFFAGDVRNWVDVEFAISKFQPDVVFHVAGQVAMTTSLERPMLDFEINALGTQHILQAVRRYAPRAKVFYSSTNKVYGDLEYLTLKETPTRYESPEFPNGLDEKVRLDFTTPYGCSKGSADQYILDAYRSYGIDTVVFRHSSIFGGRQFSTFDQGWVGWFTQRACLAKQNKLDQPFTVAGNGKQVRDVLFAPDLVKCYFMALDKIDQCKGQAFNIGGGMANSSSILELLSFLESRLEVKLNYQHIAVRSSDQKYFVADIQKARNVFGWEPQIQKEKALAAMIEWVQESLGKS